MSGHEDSGTLMLGSSSPSQILAEFAADAIAGDLSTAVTEATKVLLLDTIASAVGGWNSPSARVVNQTVADLGGVGQCTVFVSGDQLPAPSVAYINSHLGNALDAEDTLTYVGHVAAPAVAAAVAVGEWRRSCGADILAAITIGYEVAGRIGTSLRTVLTTEDGRIQFTPGVGCGWVTYGATVAAGRLLGLNADRMRQALGIAVLSTPTSRSERFGFNAPRPMAKYGLYGLYAQSGLMAALLAKRGFTADLGSFDGGAGIWPVRDWADDTMALVGDLGSRWSVEQVAYKPYPACRYLCGAIDLFLGIMQDEQLAPADVERVEARIPAVALPRDGKRTVETLVDGCFDLPYLLAAAALAGPPGPAWHDAATRQRTDIRAFAERVTLAVEPSAATAIAEDLVRLGYRTRMPTTIVLTAHGRNYERYTEYALGDPYTADTHVTYEMLVGKARNFMTSILGPAKTENSITTILNLEAAPDAETLTKSLVR